VKEKIKNIVFDLGDVIINIDVPRAAHSFAALANRDINEVIQLFKEANVFGQFETGQLSEIEFRAYLKNILGHPNWDDQTIDTAWNALLLDIPPQRVELIKLLGSNYRLFLLSNTSSIHVEAVNQILHQTTGVEKLDVLFEKLFLSYEMGVMKPHPTIYERVLEEANLVAEQTLFLDDNADNIKAAGELGIQTIHVQKPLSILDYLHEYAN
jgi:putative hydrolase of the HAD superfamily